MRYKSFSSESAIIIALFPTYLQDSRVKVTFIEQEADVWYIYIYIHVKRRWSKPNGRSVFTSKEQRMKGRKKVMRPKPIEVFQHARITVWPSYRVFEEAPVCTPDRTFFLVVALDSRKKSVLFLKEAYYRRERKISVKISAELLSFIFSVWAIWLCCPTIE